MTSTSVKQSAVGSQVRHCCGVLVLLILYSPAKPLPAAALWVVKQYKIAAEFLTRTLCHGAQDDNSSVILLPIALSMQVKCAEAGHIEQCSYFSESHEQIDDLNWHI